MFTAIYEETRSGLYKFCLVRLHGDTASAEDCVQNTFTVLYARLKSGETFQNPRAFLYRTADNLVKKRWREEKTERLHIVPLDEAEDQAAPQAEFSVDDTFDFDKCAEKLLLCMNDAERTLYALRYTQNLSIEEIADELGVSAPAAAMRLSRVRQKIKTAVRETMTLYGEGG